MNIRDLYAFLEEKIPSSLSCEWDNDGLLVCPNPEKEVGKVLVSLDVTERVVRKALAEEYDLILSHHPIIFHPLSCVEPGDPVAKKVIDLLAGGVSVMSFHTRLDALEDGVNDRLAGILGLTDIRPFGQNGETIGRIGKIPKPTTLDEFAKTVKEKLHAPSVAYAGNRRVETVAVLGGGGADDVEAAKEAGADTYLTGELKYHQLVDAPECGMNLLAAGHYYTEAHICEKLKSLALEAAPGLVVDTFYECPVLEV
ncbi:MAG: Nif3-like dinuclear metal center hexameric protein [Clostridia bacterium]|nr:Nif3-like dinuclear metal center hexameric protein [Clostridia bacterium]